LKKFFNTYPVSCLCLIVSNHKLFTAELTIWVNPNEVCYRVGERGMFQLIYGIGDNLNNRAAGGGGNQSVGINNPEGWNWIVTQVW